MNNTNVMSQSKSQVIEINRVLKNTYMLLAATLGFSALSAWFSATMNVPMIHPILTLVVYFALLFLIHKTANSGMGIVMTFALTGFMGFTLGPILSLYASIPGGELAIAQALGGTAVLFLCLSAYVIINKTNMSKALPFITIGLLVAFGLGLVNYFFLQMPIISIMVSSAFLVLSSALLMWQTSAIVNGGERNYVLATVTIFISLYNIFISMLNLIMSLGGDE